MELQAAARPDLRILVVDDEPFVLAITVHVLQQFGFQQIQTAGDGKAALDIIRGATQPFELVICDLNMPVMDGFDFMRAAQTLNYPGALIVLSSDASHSLASAVELGRECGLTVLGALHKPLEREQLRELLVKYGALSPARQFS